MDTNKAAVNSQPFWGAVMALSAVVCLSLYAIEPNRVVPDYPTWVGVAMSASYALPLAGLSLVPLVALFAVVPETTAHRDLAVFAIVGALEMAGVGKVWGITTSSLVLANFGALVGLVACALFHQGKSII